MNTLNHLSKKYRAVQNNLTLLHYILFGLLAWGLPGIYFGGIGVVYAVATVSIPVWLAIRGSRDFHTLDEAMFSENSCSLLIILLVLYLILDATIGQRKFSQNLFLSATAVNDFMDISNETISQGRGFPALIGAFAIFIPFSLFDYARSAPKRSSVLLYLLALTFICYETGIGRGYLLMASLSLLLGTSTTKRRVALAVFVSIGVFTVASLFRGDMVERSGILSPLLDGIGWPYINLSLLIDENVATGSWVDYILEFLKKFVPSFIYAKEIFSFNLEMSKVLYPGFGDYIESVSIFTYMGELLYYRPTILTAGFSGVVLALMGRQLEKLIKHYNLDSVRIFTGLMCIVLLRSRIQDVFSFLISLFVFLFGWKLLVGNSKPLTPTLGNSSPPMSSK